MKNILVKRTAIMISMTVIVSWTGPVRLFAVQINARDEAINSTIGGLAGTQQPAELAPIRIKTQEMAQGDVYLLARALHLYNQRKLSDARGAVSYTHLTLPTNREV